MIEEKILKLIERVAEKAEGLDWKTNQGTNGYYVRLGKSYVELRSDDNDDAHPYSFLILDHSDTIIESFNTGSDDMPMEARRQVDKTYAAAKRKATGIDDRLDEMLGQLD